MVAKERGVAEKACPAFGKRLGFGDGAGGERESAPGAGCFRERFSGKSHVATVMSRAKSGMITNKTDSLKRVIVTLRPPPLTFLRRVHFSVTGGQNEAHPRARFWVYTPRRSCRGACVLSKAGRGGALILAVCTRDAPRRSPQRKLSKRQVARCLGAALTTAQAGGKSGAGSVLPRGRAKLPKGCSLAMLFEGATPRDATPRCLSGPQGRS